MNFAIKSHVINKLLIYLMGEYTKANFSTGKQRIGYTKAVQFALKMSKITFISVNRPT